MVSLRASAVDAPDAHALLAEYFAAQGGGISRRHVPHDLSRPRGVRATAGVFVLVENDEGDTGGMRRHPARYPMARTGGASR